MIGCAAFAGLALLALAWFPGGLYVLGAVLVVGFSAEFIAPFFSRGDRPRPHKPPQQGGQS